MLVLTISVFEVTESRCLCWRLEIIVCLIVMGGLRINLEADETYKSIISLVATYTLFMFGIEKIAHIVFFTFFLMPNSHHVSKMRVKKV